MSPVVGFTPDDQSSTPNAVIGFTPDGGTFTPVRGVAAIAKQRHDAMIAPPDTSGQPGAVERFLKGMGLPTSVADLEALAKHYSPATNPAGPAATVVADLARTIGGEMGTQAGEGIDAAQHGEIGDAAKHALGAAFPLVGPPAAEGDLAGAAGRLTALAAPAALGKVLPKAAVPSPPEAPMSEFQQYGGTGNLQQPPPPNVNVTNVRLGPFEPQNIPDNIPPENLPSEASGGSLIGKLARSVGSLFEPSIITKIRKGVATAQELNNFIGSVVQNDAFRQTTNATPRTGFLQALQSKDLSGIATYGSAILESAPKGDDPFGHDAAVQGAVSDAMDQAKGDPSVARQILSGKGAAYVNPDGTEVAVPHYVLHSFINKVFDGHDYQGLVAGNEKGGQDSTGGAAGVPLGAEMARGREGSEWPKDPNAMDENDNLLVDRSKPRWPAVKDPGALLPTRFQNARSVTYGSPLHGMPQDTERGAYGLQFNPEAKQTESANTVLIARQPEGQDVQPGTWAHEVGHAIYTKDLSQPERQMFDGIVDGVIRSYIADAKTTGAHGEQLKALAQKYPQAIIQNFAAHTNDPERVHNESFAELFSQYMMNPTAFKGTYPNIYGAMRQIMGREYIQKKAP